MLPLCEVKIGDVVVFIGPHQFNNSPFYVLQVCLDSSVQLLEIPQGRRAWVYHWAPDLWMRHSKFAEEESVSVVP